ncbi:hypothetical protein [Deinococcus soli (ex Cha et al. 2016)]|uniref:Uncharacterized protein n=2 Tax=Deinococcus soli (ex Cha et al. 2016) TaxID=1309411 RepID=A0ACC6KFZ1_9DEIO|nr:hypothetical protein [Deinococcus soli (ex Cha et al. 2016)]MDR6218351.1 hypothetical protein [Deinococcus soli (ex Cha et al. 2016)]MDR6329091.1 hypothetical protein [Deinococcus soli (ex Cha et al. 2016)]MDR6751364.1 hypothetical protein [Deinococcus soli (ex Cha et al. 2016)]
MLYALTHDPTTTARTLLLLSALLLGLHGVTRVILARRRGAALSVNAAEFACWAITHWSLPQRLTEGEWHLTPDTLSVPDTATPRDVARTARLAAHAAQLNRDDPAPQIAAEAHRFQVASGALGALLLLLTLAGVPMTLLPGVALWGASVLTGGMRAASEGPTLRDLKVLLAQAPLSRAERRCIWRYCLTDALLASLEVGPGFFSWRQALLR